MTTFLECGIGGNMAGADVYFKAQVEIMKFRSEVYELAQVEVWWWHRWKYGGWWVENRVSKVQVLDCFDFFFGLDLTWTWTFA